MQFFTIALALVAVYVMNPIEAILHWGPQMENSWIPPIEWTTIDIRPPTWSPRDDGICNKWFLDDFAACCVDDKTPNSKYGHCASSSKHNCPGKKEEATCTSEKDEDDSFHNQDSCPWSGVNKDGKKIYPVCRPADLSCITSRHGHHCWGTIACYSDPDPTKLGVVKLDCDDGLYDRNGKYTYHEGDFCFEMDEGNTKWCGTECKDGNWNPWMKKCCENGYDPIEKKCCQDGYNPWIKKCCENGYNPWTKQCCEDGYDPITKTCCEAGYNPWTKKCCENGYNPIEKKCCEDGYNPWTKKCCDDGYDQWAKKCCENGYNPWTKRCCEDGYDPWTKKCCEKGYNPWTKKCCEDGYNPWTKKCCEHGYDPIAKKCKDRPCYTGSCGDPLFIGFHGQSYQFHGLADEIFNLVSTPTLQVNGHFVYLSSGKCDYNDTLCWSHPGTYVDQIGMIFQDRRVTFVAGTHDVGLHWKINDEPINKYGIYKVVQSNGVDVILTYHHHNSVRITSELFNFNIVNSDMFFNIEAALNDKHLLKIGAPRHTITDRILCDKEAHVDESKFHHVYYSNQTSGEHHHGMVEAALQRKYGGVQVPIHGLIGQTWRNALVCGRHWIGTVTDYVCSDLFASDYFFNYFHKE